MDIEELIKKVRKSEEMGLEATLTLRSVLENKRIIPSDHVSMPKNIFEMLMKAAKESPDAVKYLSTDGENSIFGEIE